MEDRAFPATCFISSRVRHRVATVSIREDVLIFVRRGVKTLQGGGIPVALKAGTSVVLARGSQWDVVNDPAPDGRYEALVLQFGDSAIEGFQRTHGSGFEARRTDGCFVTSPDEGFVDLILRAAHSIEAPGVSDRLRQHRVMELLLVLAEQGCVLSPREALSWPDRVRRLIASRPHAAWTAETMARACHTSASTLHRRLAEHDLTVGALIREIRLEMAMLLLQTTQLPVGEVAQRCGYDSHSRFSAVFKSRYGFLPSYLRSA